MVSTSSGTLGCGATVAVLAAVGIGATGGKTEQAHAEPRTPEAVPAVFTPDNLLERPSRYREWIFIGTSITPNDMNDGRAVFPEFHNVYLDPASYAELMDTGEFRQGATLVKELISVGGKSSTSGNGYFQGDLHGLGVMVKDAERFNSNPGGWGYFDFTDEPRDDAGTRNLTMTAPEIGASCIGCHNVAAEDDFVFTRHYPIMKWREDR